MKWEKIHLESNLLEGETTKAYLINMPKTSRYKGYSFWHPARCVSFVGKNRFLMQISFTEAFEFKLKKCGKGKFNFKDVLDEKILSVDEFKEVLGFSNEVLDNLKEEED